MAQLVASMSGVVLGGVVEVVGSKLAGGKIFTASIGSVDSLYPSIYIYRGYIYIYIYIYIYTLNIRALYLHFDMLCPLNKAKVIFLGSSLDQFYFPISNWTLSSLQKYLFLFLSFQFCIIYGTCSQKCTGNF